MKKFTVTLFLSVLLITKASADEGMWLPLLLKALCQNEMQTLGLKLSADDLYSINKSSLKDAIVLFGGGCTGEIVSDKGLLFTNHHCGIGQVQYHSTVENDYIKNGFWAKSYSDELPNPNLSVTFIVRIEDVTKDIRAIIDADKNTSQKAIIEKMDELEKKAIEGTGYEADIKAFDYGNAYYLFVTETFKDVRLVAAPPQALGEFGGDTDNWIWPRHTADFSIFRIYANKENKPAEYSKDNIPYKPKKSLVINTDGVKENDFAMVYGFPGRTQQYLPSEEVEFIMNLSDPAKIAMRDKSLQIINEAMHSNDKIRIQYTAKESRISNAWKKWKGEVTGLKKTNALEKKKSFESDFTKRVYENVSFTNKYSDILEAFRNLLSTNREMLIAYDYFNEFYYSCGPELIKFAANFENLVNNYTALEKDGKLIEVTDKLKNSVKVYYKNLDVNTDKKLFTEVLSVYIKGCPLIYQPEYLTNELGKKKNSIQLLADELYSSSILINGDELLKALDKPSSLVSKMKSDKIYLMTMGWLDMYRKKIDQQIKSYYGKHDQLMNRYVSAIYEVIPEKKIWHDANSTLRISYGQVKGSEPRDGMTYNYFTTTDGMIEKYNSGAEEYILPQKFLELIGKKDFGNYADSDGNLRTCFTTTSQTTGGNSGSPVINAYGELIGLNFDRSWESTMSDIMYSSKLCRNIVCDIRYVLFVIDKYAGATNLINELKLSNQTLRNEQEKQKIKTEILELTEQLKLHPENVAMLTQRAQKYFELNMNDDALLNAQSAIQIDSKYLAAWKLEAQIYLKQKENIKALFHAEKAYQIDNKNIENKQLYIKCLYLNQQFKKCTELSKTMNEQEISAEMANIIAKAHFAIGSNKEAQNWYKLAKTKGNSEIIMELE